jgi:hypothetical protein
MNLDLTFSEDLKKCRNSQKSDTDSTRETVNTPPAYAKESKDWKRFSSAGEFKTA